MKNSPTRVSQDGERVWNIRDRAFEFAVRVVKLCKLFEERAEVSKSLIWQLIRSGTSVGANLEEAQAGQTKPDFVAKNSISLKEARESNFWLRLILASYELEPADEVEAKELRDESREISLVIGAIIAKSLGKR